MLRASPIRQAPDWIAERQENNQISLLVILSKIHFYTIVFPTVEHYPRRTFFAPKMSIFKGPECISRPRPGPASYQLVRNTLPWINELRDGSQDTSIYQHDSVRRWHKYPGSHCLYILRHKRRPEHKGDRLAASLGAVNPFNVIGKLESLEAQIKTGKGSQHGTLSFLFIDGPHAVPTLNNPYGTRRVTVVAEMR